MPFSLGVEFGRRWGRRAVGVLCPFDAAILGILRLATRGEAQAPKRRAGSSRVMSRRSNTVQCRASSAEICPRGVLAPRAILSAAKLARHAVVQRSGTEARRVRGSAWTSARRSAMIGLSGAGERACRTARTAAATPVRPLGRPSSRLRHPQVDGLIRWPAIMPPSVTKSVVVAFRVAFADRVAAARPALRHDRRLWVSSSVGARRGRLPPPVGAHAALWCRTRLPPLGRVAAGPSGCPRLRPHPRSARR